MPIRRLKTRLGLSRRYVVLSDFMLCPVFIGNHHLEDKCTRLGDVLQWKQRETITERGADFIMKFYEYYLDR